MSDVQRLNLLSTLYLIAGAIPILFAAVLLLTSTLDSGGQEWPVVPRFVPDIVFNASYVVQMAFWLGLGCAAILSGLCLRMRKRRRLSLVVAVFVCLAVPIGTLLGIYTIIVLRMETVRKIYEQAGPMFHVG